MSDAHKPPLGVSSIRNIDARLAAMAALLDEIPHARLPFSLYCRDDCLACAWEKLRDEPLQNTLTLPEAKANPPH